MDIDFSEKRATFIDGSLKVRDMFSFAHPKEIITAIEKYCTSFHSSNLWDLSSGAVQSIISAWHVNAKLSWNMNRDCRTYFVDHLLAPHCPPLMATLLSKYHGFFLSLLESPSDEVQIIARLAARDLRSHLGSNL